jgi:hypothetical protein
LGRGLSLIDIPPRIGDDLDESCTEAMAYPRIDLPMYEPLKAISIELFLPNLNLVPANSITLLETNQEFIESYMVGLNHEFARKLLWREYPTDQRGSYFRQFWDVRSFFSSDNTVDREKLYDIPELHLWRKHSNLGDHNNRAQAQGLVQRIIQPFLQLASKLGVSVPGLLTQGATAGKAVLVIRGELLKKYPTAVIFAQRAQWQYRSDGSIDNTKPRVLTDLVADEEANPPGSKVRTPLYEAKADPDIYFFGFDLTAEAARGGAVVDGEEDPGWFFVIKERPGEPRFGLDLPQDGPARTAVPTWNELSWTDVVDGYDTAVQLPVGLHTVSVTATVPDPLQKPQHDEDDDYRWQADTDAAELAYILYQLPVLMAVHANEMLRTGE